MFQTRAEEPIVNVPIHLHSHLVEMNRLVPSKLPLQALHVDHHVPIESYLHLWLNLISISSNIVALALN